MKNKYNISYPFLYEKNLLCDYEIETDSLTGKLGFANSFCRDENLKKDIQDLAMLVYHSNGSIRGNNAIKKEDIDYIYSKIEFYTKKIEGRVKRFVLPQGGNLASALHIARSQGKRCVRMLFRVKEYGNKVDEILFDFMNMVTNYIFALALYANKLENINEVDFISKSY